MLWQVSLLIIVIGAIDRLIRSWAWPEVRHALWLLVIIKLLVPPGWSFSGAVFPRLIGPLTETVTERWPAAETAKGVLSGTEGRPANTVEGSRAAGTEGPNQGPKTSAPGTSSWARDTPMRPW